MSSHCVPLPAPGPPAAQDSRVAHGYICKLARKPRQAAAHAPQDAAIHVPSTNTTTGRGSNSCSKHPMRGISGSARRQCAPGKQHGTAPAASSTRTQIQRLLHASCLQPRLPMTPRPGTRPSSPISPRQRAPYWCQKQSPQKLMHGWFHAEAGGKHPSMHPPISQQETTVLVLLSEPDLGA